MWHCWRTLWQKRMMKTSSKGGYHFLILSFVFFYLFCCGCCNFCHALRLMKTNCFLFSTPHRSPLPLHIAFIVAFINCSLIAITHTHKTQLGDSLVCPPSQSFRYDDLSDDGLANRVLLSASVAISLQLCAALSSLVTFDLPTCHQVH